MNLGLALFLSAIFLGSIWLYYITRDRWEWKIVWKRVLKYLGIAFIVFWIIVGVVKLVEYLYNQPKTVSDVFQADRVDTFWDISIDSKPSSIKFLKGNPSKTKFSDSIWIYYPKSGYRHIYYKITFNDSSLFSILYYGDYYYSPLLFKQEFYGINTELLLERLGNPTKVSYSPDDLERIYSFSNYNLVFFLRRDRVYSFGIYNPLIGSYNY